MLRHEGRRVAYVEDRLCAAAVSLLHEFERMTRATLLH
jgi:hypothetical protein